MDHCLLTRLRDDNARIESIHSLVKQKYVNMVKFSNMNEVMAGIDRYIRWYNHERITLLA
ncbi:integrase core domain-containing protein [Leuconostoc citreum]